MKNPLKPFCEWLQATDDYGGTVSYLVLYSFPGYAYVEEMSDTRQKLIDLLLHVEEGNRAVGVALYIQSAVDYFTKEYDNIDETLDHMNFLKGVAEQEQDPQRSEFIASKLKRLPEAFERRKTFKAEWEISKSQVFNFNYFKKYDLEQTLKSMSRE